MPPTARRIAGVDDSKKLKPAVRERLAGQIRSGAVAWALGAASVREIEQLNILQATILAMRRSCEVTPEEASITRRQMSARRIDFSDRITENTSTEVSRLVRFRIPAVSISV
jgi:ribonuclease HII